MRAELADADAIFCAAIELPTDEARREYVLRACGDNVDLRAAVEALLAAHFAAGSFLESRPATLLYTDEDLLVETPGSVIGPYKLLQQIGEGGMGVVFMAEQTRPVQRTVALKIIRPGMDSRQVIARFEAERQALALMDHPNIARVLDAGSTLSGRPYFVMDLVKGVPITEYCDRQHLSIRERLELVAAVCNAVQHAHQKGIIHRDIKPSNVLVAEYDGRPVPKVIDFGVAKATSQRLTEKTMFTQFGQLIGTFEYMSPEQARFNQLDVDTRSDIYSLGVLLYELLTGTTPLEKVKLRAAAFDEMLRSIREEEPPPPSTRLYSAEALPSIAANRGIEPKKLTSLVRGDLDLIVLKALEKNRTRRYESVGAFAADIQHYLSDEPIQARSPSQIYRLAKFARRHKVGVAAGTAIAVTLLAGLIASSYFAASASREASRAKAEQAKAEANRKQAEDINQFFMNEVFGLADPNRNDRTGISLVEALDVAAGMVDSRFPDDPALRAVVRERLGEIYSEIDEPYKAVDQLRAAVELRQLAFGDKDPRTLRSRGDLGAALYKASRMAESKQILESALAEQTTLLGVGDPDRIKTGNSLTLVLMNIHDVNDLKLSEAIYRDALAALGPQDPATLASQSNYAWVLRWREINRGGQIPGHPPSLQMAEEAIRGLRQITVEGNIRTMFASYGYGACLQEAGRYRDAADEFQRLLPLRYRILGPSHVDSLFTAWRTAENLRLAGEPDAAIVVLEGVRGRLASIEAADKVRRAEPLALLAKVAIDLKQMEIGYDCGASACRMYDAVLESGSIEGVNFEHLFTLVHVLSTQTSQSKYHEVAFNLAKRACEVTNYQNNDAVGALQAACFGKGEVALAEELVNEGLALNPDDARLRTYAAILRLNADDLDGYRVHCAAMAAQLATRSNRYLETWLALLSSLVPSAVDDYSRPRQWAAKLVESDSQNQWHLSIQGMLAYRAGDYQSAVAPLSKTVELFGAHGCESTEPVIRGGLVLAMTQWQLGRKVEARRTLANAQAMFERDDFTTIWDDRMILNHLRREAEQLIQ